jgi:hypothetical protein
LALGSLKYVIYAYRGARELLEQWGLANPSWFCSPTEFTLCVQV